MAGRARVLNRSMDKSGLIGSVDCLRLDVIYDFNIFIFIIVTNDHVDLESIMEILTTIFIEL